MKMSIAGFALVIPLLAACAGGPEEPAVAYPTTGSIERLDPRLDKLLPKDAKIEVLAKGFIWTEGPLWIKEGNYLLFSDIPNNRIVKWSVAEGAKDYLIPAGYTGSVPRGEELGSNGLILDPQGRLVLCQHGDRRMARMDAPLAQPAPKFTTLAGKYDGKRLNSPNDACYHSKGALYFTDPPYGLVKRMDDPAKELDFQGVFRLATDGTVTLLTKLVTRPNGIAFSPDETKLYVASSDPDKPIWMVYDMKADGTIGGAKVFYDASKQVAAKLKGLPDGLKVDVRGNVWATGPGGVLVFSPDGTLLGTIKTGEATSNCAWGDDGTILYMTCDDFLMRIKTTSKGRGF